MYLFVNIVSYTIYLYWKSNFSFFIRNMNIFKISTKWSSIVTKEINNLIFIMKTSKCFE